MEEETLRMEAKLHLLRRTMDAADQNKSSGGVRWKSGSSKEPLARGYVEEVLAETKGRVPLAQRHRIQGSAADQEDATHNVQQARGTSDFVTLPLEPISATVRAAGHLRAAVFEQYEDFLEVASFLVAAGLNRHTSLFLEHGFDCMETVQDMEESHMQAIVMATGHMLKLRKTLRERQMPSGFTPFESKNGEMSMGNTKRVAISEWTRSHA